MNIDKTKIIMVVVAGLILLLFLDQILKAIGLKKDKGDKQKDALVFDLTSNPYFDPMLYKGKAFAAIGDSVANQYAKDIRSAFGIFNDNEDSIYTTFAKLKNKMNISEVAEAYYKNYNSHLLPDLLNRLSDKEKALLQNVINNLP